MPIASKILPFLLSCAAAAAAAGGEPRLSWNSANGERTWSVEIGAGDSDAKGQRLTPFEAPVWFEPLPAVDVPLLDGGSFPFTSARGKVLLLDFWASWCAPCMEELPRMQELFVAERPHGLVAIAINADEPAEVVRRTAEALELTVPIGTWDRRVDETLRVRRLPLVILADRRGRIRDRWDGWFPGIEKTIAARVRELLAEQPAGPRRSLGQVLEGTRALEVEWARDLGATVTGLAVLPVPGAPPRIVAAAGREVAVLERDGRIAARQPAPAAAGRLVLADLDGNGCPRIAAFRPGGKEVALIDLSIGTSRSFSVPFHVLDLAFADAASPEWPQGVFALAAVDGLYLADSDGQRVRRIEGTGETLSVTRTGKGDAQRFLALGADRTLRWVDPAGRIERSAPAGPEDSGIVAGEDADGGFGTASTGGVAGAAGRFLAGGATQLAFATGSSLVVLDRSSGAEVWRARWPGIVDLVAADLDADGRSELLVAFDSTVALVRTPR